ncbi:MAG TPA: TlpA disulfide reductase family protein [Alphaproteobacteria bacterium]|nr:TlpA disulfide reductase family protein [Alphaproteobacteria bacterium]
MSARLRWLLIAAGAAIALLILIPLFRAQGPSVSGPAGMVGATAPVFALRDDRGGAASLAQYRGKIVVMNLWASWCPPCRAEMPDLQTVAREFAKDGVVVVGVNQGESAARAAAFAASLRITFPIWIDDAQQYGRVYAALGLPTTVVIDRRGIVERGFDGPLTVQQMRSAIGQAVRAS